MSQIKFICSRLKAVQCVNPALTLSPLNVSYQNWIGKKNKEVVKIKEAVKR
jgi:hypothetical protein